jgi:hypothetical protein
VDALGPVLGDLGVEATQIPVADNAGVLLKEHWLLDGGGDHFSGRRQGRRRLRCRLRSLSPHWVTDQAGFTGTTLVVLGKGPDLTRAVAHHAVLAAFNRVWYYRYLQQRLYLVAHKAGIICPPLMIVGKGDELAWRVARQAILPVLHRVRY